MRTEVRAGEQVIAVEEATEVPESTFGEVVYEWNFDGLPRPVGEKETWTVLVYWQEDGKEQSLELRRFTGT